MDLATVTASVAGAVGSKLVFHPLDTIRTLQQTSTNFSYVLPFKAYWRGLGAATLLTTPAFTIYMVSYRQTKKELLPYLGDSFANYVVAGSAAEFASSVIWTPMEVVKGRMQIDQHGYSTGQLVQKIYQTEGLRGFFRGYWMGIAVFLPHSVVWWSTYELGKSKLAQFTNKSSADLSSAQYAMASALASTSAATASNFLDVVKTRQQLAVSEEISRLRPEDQLGVFRVAKNLIKEVGLVRALFKGLHIRLAHSLPSSILAMVIVERLNPDRTSNQTSPSNNAIPSPVTTLE